MWKACNRLGQTTQRAWERSQNNIRKPQVRDREGSSDQVRCLRGIANPISSVTHLRRMTRREDGKVHTH